MSLIEELLEYKKGTCDRRWKKSQKFSYKNDYIELVSLDSSNKWLSSTEMEKQWSIIIEKKKDFTLLPNFSLLKEQGLLTLTPVNNGANKGCFGIRLYGMKKDPDEGIIKKLLDFIFEGCVLTLEEQEILSKMTEEEIEILFNAEDDTAGFLYKEELAKVRKLNKHIIDTLKKMYKGECQLCGGKVGEQYGKEIVEAHHIEYFSQTQKKAPSKIIILCPNCQARIQKCNPAYDKKTCSFKFDNGKSLSIKTKGHLKGKL